MEHVPDMDHHVHPPVQRRAERPLIVRLEIMTSPPPPHPRPDRQVEPQMRIPEKKYPNAHPPNLPLSGFFR
jgi:hypothetical protein